MLLNETMNLSILEKLKNLHVELVGGGGGQIKHEMALEWVIIFLGESLWVSYTILYKMLIWYINFNAKPNLIYKVMPR